MPRFVELGAEQVLRRDEKNGVAPSSDTIFVEHPLRSDHNIPYLPAQLLENSSPIPAGVLPSVPLRKT